MAIKIPTYPALMPDRSKPSHSSGPNIPFRIQEFLGHRYSQQCETFNESKGTTPWAKGSIDRIYRKYMWLSVIASKGIGKIKYDPFAEKYTAHPYRTYTIK
jgi:hypothetical protein